MSITYEAVLPLREDTVLFLTGLLDLEQARRGTRTGTRSLNARDQAILVLRWFLDDTRMSQLARDNRISVSTAYDYRDEAISVLGARRPGLHGALLAAKAAGRSHVILDGTLIPTDRSCRPSPTPGVDLWWSGKHKHHGGNVQVLSAPDGWPLWTSVVRPGREHDTTAARTDPVLLHQITEWVQDGGLALADLGYQGEAHLFRLPAKKPKSGGTDRGPTGLQRLPNGPTLPRRTSELPNQDHLPGPYSNPRKPLAHRRRTARILRSASTSTGDSCCAHAR